MNQETNMAAVRDIMIDFADQTGLTDTARPPRRYLWTDAFAVCNFLGLFRQTGDEEYRRLALALIEQVHRVLGRHRGDDPRQGWISGLGEEEGARHPTAGGLRIGKEMNERGPYEPWDERLEWDRDGQYLHYLTKWMHALSQASAVTGDPAYNRWAVEMAKTAQARFAYAPLSGGAKRTYWKMSIDLSRPLVPAMGLHDPLNAFITYSELRMRAQEIGGDAPPDLDAEVADAAKICEGKNWDTHDSLGIGGLLFDAGRACQMIVAGYFEDLALLEALLSSSARGLDAFVGTDPLSELAAYRLAFRELGLSIGLHAVGTMEDLLEGHPGRFANKENLQRRLAKLHGYLPVGAEIEAFWLRPESLAGENRSAHRDINMVMLATSLLPEGFLSL